MSSPPPPPQNDPSVPSTSYGYQLIRLGFLITGVLAGTVVVFGSINNFKSIDPSVLTLVSSTITGILAFLAGRKS